MQFIKHTYSRSFNQIIDSRGTPPSLVPLTIPTLAADHRTLSAANAVPSSSPFTSHAPSTPYPSPLSATTPSATSHTPQEPISDLPRWLFHPPAHRPLYTHPQISTTIPPLPECKRGRPKGSVKIKPVTYGPRPRLGRPPGNGYKQRLRALLGKDAARAAKRSRGWLQKQDSSPVSVQFGKVVGCYINITFPLLIYS